MDSIPPNKGSPAGILSRPECIRVILIGGQSNADGRADPDDLADELSYYRDVQHTVPLYHHVHGAAANEDGTPGFFGPLKFGATEKPTGGFGPEIALGYELSRRLRNEPGVKLAIIKYAKGGSSLHADWKAGAPGKCGGPHYEIFQRVVAAGLATLRAENPMTQIEPLAMVWVQGESDIDAGRQAVARYADNLSALIADIRSKFGCSFPFVLSRISANQSIYSGDASSYRQNYLALREQQESVATAVPSVYMLDTDAPDFATNRDRLHFSALGQITLGRACATTISRLLCERSRRPVIEISPAGILPP